VTEFTYRDAGLDLDAYERSMAALPPLMRRTWGPHVFGPEGGFAALFDFHALAEERGFRRPVLVTCTDGVGSKLRIAQAVGRHDTVGIDLVAMSVNDCLCTGAEPLVFLDYLAMPADDPPLTAALVRGVSDGCVQAGCALVGGETAILPDSYSPGDYDLAGFCAGAVERDAVVDGRAVQVGDVVVGLAASGLHSNGYSLVRKVVFGHAGLQVSDPVPELGRTVGEELLEPTRIYVKPILKLLREPTLGPAAIHGLAHITGGGLVDNLPRVLPAGRRAVLRRGSWPVPPVFDWLRRLGNIPPAEMDRVFNNGVGFCVVVRPDAADATIRALATDSVPAWPIGEIVAGDPGVDWA
jgi:phosphoribosylformylglycinamidine cyclo-ligase